MVIPSDRCTREMRALRNLHKKVGKHWIVGAEELFQRVSAKLWVNVDCIIALLTPAPLASR